MSVIFITHNLAVVAQICDTVAVMYAGKIMEKGTVDEIFYSPLHPYTLGLLKSMPRIDETEGFKALEYRGDSCGYAEL